MVISKHFSSVFMLILAFSLAMPLDAMVAQQPHEQVKKSKKQSIVPKKSLRGHIQQFIRKHKTTLATIGALGAFLLVACLVPKTKLNTGQPAQPSQQANPPLEHLDQMRRAIGHPFNVGQSQCVGLGEVALQPGIQRGNWTPHLVDGNNGDYAWRNLRNNQRVFVPHGAGLNRNEAFPERSQIAVRFRLQEPIRVRQLAVVPQVGDTCAYHALKNCQLILDELENPQGNLAARLTDPALVRDRIGRWRDHILANHPQRCSVQDGQWLHPEGLRELVNLENDNRITVVDAGRFQEQLVRDPLALPQPYDLNADPNRDLVHGFVVQDRAHWLTAVFRRVRGQIEWLIVDSNNQPAFHRAGLMHLLARLHGRIA